MEKPTSVQLNGYLSVVRGKLVNSENQTIMLRGCSLFWSQWKSEFYNYDLVKWLRNDWKIDIIRVAMAVDHGGYLDKPDAQLARVDAIVRAAIDLGIYVVIDWHTHEKYLEKAADFFVEICRKYYGVPNVIFELWNEPSDKYSWDLDIKPYHEYIIEKIRRYNRKAIIIAGTESFSKRVDIAAFDPLKCQNILYSFHFYAASHKDRFRSLIETSAKNKIPLIASEWGVCEANGNGKTSLRESRKWLTLLEKHNISYLNWAISDKLEAASVLKPGANPTGEWHKSDLTKSGLFIRKDLRRKRAKQSSVSLDSW